MTRIEKIIDRAAAIMIMLIVWGTSFFIPDDLLIYEAQRLLGVTE